MQNLFGEKIQNDPLLRDKFIEPPFSVLDSKGGNWRRRVSAWRSKGILGDVGRSLNKNRSGNELLQGLISNSSLKSVAKDSFVSIFDPALAELIYHWFCPEGGKILDPFAGGSVRGIVANYMGYNYTGIDIREEQIISNREQAINILPVNRQPQWYVGDSNIVLNELHSEYDLVFSCPPYADLEVYSDLDGDISNMRYPEFIKAYSSIIYKSCERLRSGGHAAFVIGEVRDNKGNYYGFVPDTIKAFEDAGMKYYNECIYLNGLAGACLTAGRIMGISKKVKKVHQNVLVFKKQ